jgi:glutamate dehydrogenase (NAD(P)+)
MIECECGILNDEITRLNNICTYLKIDSKYSKYLSHPYRSVTVNFPVKMEDGSLESFEGYRVLHSQVLGPGKGGFFLDPDTSIQEVQALAMIMSWKCSLIGLPLSGAKGAIKVDSKTLSEGEKEKLVRRYTQSIINVIGPNLDIPSPDLNTNAQTMAWMMDTYSMGVGKTVPGICTGKPIEIGGIIGRNRSVGMGMAYLLRNYAERESEEIKNKKIVIQGFGHVGKNIALSSEEFGAKIIAISDSSTGLFDENGLDIQDLISFKTKTGTLKGYDKSGVDEITNEALLQLECDVLLPSATKCQITIDNVDKLQCSMIIEGANAAITSQADTILQERKVTVIPDIIANAGGLIVSYFEWVQDLSRLSWSIGRVSSELEKIILEAFNRIYQIKQDYSISYRQAAYIVAIKRFVAAIKYRGFYP